MPTLETISLKDYGIGRQPHEPLSIWYGQPILRLPDEPPFIPYTGPYATGLQILRGILEHRDLRESDCTPAIIVLPELAIPYTDINEARTLISNAPKGTLVVFGAGQMTEEEVLSLENNPDLWDGGAAGRFANCAVIGMGGSDKLFLQPKLLKSALEKDYHWPGRIVRCFVGDYLRFSVFICSDLLNRPGNSSYMTWLHDQLEREQNKLSFALWLQHNPKPRSDQFSNAIDAVSKMDRTMVVVCGSTMSPRERRYENFAVSGALVRRSLFPSEFGKFTHRFHYVEHAVPEVSRAVLLRYDADAYRVRTVLADALDAGDKVEKGELFDSSQPYVFSNGALQTSSDNDHIRDLCEPAKLVARAAVPDLLIAIDSVSSRLVQMDTPGFLNFLDLGIVPRVANGEKPHIAGERHEGGDLKCRCWQHRSCIDLLTDTEGAKPLAAIIQALAVLEDSGCAPKPRYDPRLKTNVDLTIAGSQSSLVMVYPSDLTLEALQRKLFGERPQVLNRQVLFVANPVERRPAVDSINVAEAPTLGAIDPAKAALPAIAPMYASDVRRAGLAGDPAVYLGRFFAGK